MYDEIGKKFNGAILTLERYEEMKDEYLDVILSFAKESDIRDFVIRNLGCREKFEPSDGDAIEIVELRAFMRDLLREKFWVQLVAGEAYIHFGLDYYIYVGVPHGCEGATRLASELNSYAEEIAAPYENLWE